MKCKECGYCDHLSSTEGDICPARDIEDAKKYAQLKLLRALRRWVKKNRCGGFAERVLAKDLQAWTKTREHKLKEEICR